MVGIKVIPSSIIIFLRILSGVSVQSNILSEKIAVEASRGLRWRPPLLIFHSVMSFYGYILIFLHKLAGGLGEALMRVQKTRPMKAPGARFTKGLKITT
jgi:hypothetical protein